MYFLYWCYYPNTSIGWVVSQRLGFKAADWFRSYGDENMGFCRAGKFSKGVALVQRGSAIKKSTRCIFLCCVSISVMISKVMQSLIERKKTIENIPNPLQKHLLTNSQSCATDVESLKVPDLSPSKVWRWKIFPKIPQAKCQFCTASAQGWFNLVSAMSA